VFAMLGSGLQIYDANPVFGGREGFHLSSIVLHQQESGAWAGFLPLDPRIGGWLGGGRHWHLFFMWFFGINLLWYGIYVFYTKRWKNRYVGESDLKVIREGTNPKRKNYAFHRLVYTGFIPILLLALLTGLGMWKPVQFGWIPALFGSWQNLRTAHFIAVPAVLMLVAFHSLLALKVGEWRLVRSIFT